MPGYCYCGFINPQRSFECRFVNLLSFELSTLAGYIVHQTTNRSKNTTVDESLDRIFSGLPFIACPVRQ